MAARIPVPPPQSGAPKLDITAEEADRLTKALENPEMVKLLQDYMKEISDPKNKKEYEDYIAQVERQSMEDNDGQGVTTGTRVCKPIPWFCVKTRITKGKPAGAKEGLYATSNKIFINICHSPQIKPMSSESKPGGKAWQIPYSQTVPRTCTDNSGVECSVHDIIFATTTKAIIEGSNNPQMKAMAVSTALKGIEKINGVSVDKEKYVILQRAKFKGEAPPAVTLKGDPTQDGDDRKAAADASDSKTTSKKKNKKKKKKPAGGGTDSATSMDGGSSSGTGPDNTTKSKEDLVGDPLQNVHKWEKQQEQLAQVTAAAAAQGTEVTPEYRIVERGEMIQSHTFESEREEVLGSGRPKELVLKVDLPNMEKMADAVLDVKTESVHLEVVGLYRLDAPLPYPVDADAGAAKFSRRSSQLTVTLPVLPLQPHEVQRIRTQRREAIEAIAARRSRPENPLEPSKAEDAPRASLTPAQLAVPASAHGHSQSAASPALHASSDPLRPSQLSPGLSPALHSSSDPSKSSKKKKKHVKLPAGIPHGLTWHQTRSNVTVVVKAKNPLHDKTNIQFAENGLIHGDIICADASKSRTISLHMELFSDIVPDKCRLEYNTVNVVLHIPKAAECKWPSLDKSGVLGSPRSGPGSPAVRRAYAPSPQVMQPLSLYEAPALDLGGSHEAAGQDTNEMKRSASGRRVSWSSTLDRYGKDRKGRLTEDQKLRPLLKNPLDPEQALNNLSLLSQTVTVAEDEDTDLQAALAASLASVDASASARAGPDAVPSGDTPAGAGSETLKPSDLLRGSHAWGKLSKNADKTAANRASSSSVHASQITSSRGPTDSQRERTPLVQMLPDSPEETQRLSSAAAAAGSGADEKSRATSAAESAPSRAASSAEMPPSYVPSRLPLSTPLWEQAPDAAPISGPGVAGAGLSQLLSNPLLFDID